MVYRVQACLPAPEPLSAPRQPRRVPQPGLACNLISFQNNPSYISKMYKRKNIPHPRMNSVEELEPGGGRQAVW